MLTQQIQTDFITAMKAKDKEKLDTLKMLRAAVKDAQIEHNVGADRDRPLPDEEVVAVLRKELKKRQDAVAMFSQANRQDLVDKESAEMTIIEAYLPQLMDQLAIEKEVDLILAQVGETADFGKVMGMAMGKLKGKADGQLVSTVIKTRLSQKR